ncbi:hypothetical protein UFOVP29_102 [uncultured Caudovirales phage]|uniref:Uncharacterized protein n=1 Tax=uncultured Caudovirales phage TaxID=2100421 RepID=A0A6J5KKZ0_9CAUD|nr:hypothetical protein UFOVP29_102 [uncultured Caudovirales phage]
MTHIIQTLWQINALDSNTVVKARYTSRDYQGMQYVNQGDFYPLGVKSTDDQVYLQLRNCSGLWEISAQPEDILSMDGMSPERFVSVFNLNWDGTNRYTGKKRGRRRKQVA